MPLRREEVTAGERKMRKKSPLRRVRDLAGGAPGSSAPQSPSAGGWPWPVCWRWWSSSAPWRVPTLLGDLIQVLYDCWAGLRSPAAWRPPWCRGILALLGIYAVQSLFTYLKMLLMNNVVSRHFTCDLRIAIADKFQRLPVSFVDDTPVGEILQRMTDDVSRMGQYRS